MIKTIDMLLYEYRDYSNIYNKIEIDGTKVMISSREKALLDMLSIISPRNNKNELLDKTFIKIYDDLKSLLKKITNIVIKIKKVFNI